MRSLQPPDILWIHWRVYNTIANTSKRVLFLPSSDVYVRSFLYLLYIFSSVQFSRSVVSDSLRPHESQPLYFNKTLLHKSSERSSLVSGPRWNSSPPEAKNHGVFGTFSNHLSLCSGFLMEFFFLISNLVIIGNVSIFLTS